MLQNAMNCSPGQFSRINSNFSEKTRVNLMTDYDNVLNTKNYFSHFVYDFLSWKPLRSQAPREMAESWGTAEQKNSLFNNVPASRPL